MVARRRRIARQSGPALGDFISAQLPELQDLARQLNGETEPRPVVDRWPERYQVVAALADDAAAIIEAALGQTYPDVPPATAERFNAMADKAPLHYVVGAWRPKDAKHFFFTSGSVSVYLRTNSGRGAWVIRLARFLVNPQRARLRRCPACRRWFVDETRNKSARRCSRECTITWSNAQRAKKRSQR
jgi:hypothetical protein